MLIAHRDVSAVCAIDMNNNCAEMGPITCSIETMRLPATKVDRLTVDTQTQRNTYTPRTLTALRWKINVQKKIYQQYFFVVRYACAVSDVMAYSIRHCGMPCCRQRQANKKKQVKKKNDSGLSDHERLYVFNAI